MPEPQAQSQNDLRRLYGVASQVFNVGDFDTFRSKISDPARRKKFYDSIQATGKVNLGDYDLFSGKVDAGLAEGQPPITGKPGRIASVEDLLAGKNRLEVVEADKHNIPPSPMIAEMQNPWPNDGLGNAQQMDNLLKRLPVPQSVVGRQFPRKADEESIAPIDRSTAGSLKRSAEGIVNLIGSLPAGFESLNSAYKRAVYQDFAKQTGRPEKEVQAAIEQEIDRRRKAALEPAYAAEEFSKKYIGAQPGWPQSFETLRSNPLEIASQAFIENAPQSALFAGATAINPALGELLMYASEAGETSKAFADLEKSGVKVDPVYRDYATVAKGALNAALEKTGTDKILEKAGPGAKGFLLKLLGTGATEGGTEWLQEVNGVLAETGAQLSAEDGLSLKRVFDVTLNELIKSKPRLEQAAIGGAFGGIGTGIGVEGARKLAEMFPVTPSVTQREQAGRPQATKPTQPEATPQTSPPAVSADQQATEKQTAEPPPQAVAPNVSQKETVAQAVYGQPFANLTLPQKNLISKKIAEAAAKDEDARVSAAVKNLFAPKEEKKAEKVASQTKKQPEPALEATAAPREVIPAVTATDKIENTAHPSTPATKPESDTSPAQQATPAEVAPKVEAKTKPSAEAPTPPIERVFPTATASGQAKPEIVSPVEGSEAAQAEKQVAANVQQLPITDISTDVDRFQNRASDFSEKTAATIAERYDPNLFDPIVVWRDPANGKTFVLSGHSRLEGMKRRGEKNIPARYFEGDEQAAMNYAQVQANRLGTAENLSESIKAYRKAKAQNLSQKKLEDLFDGNLNFLDAAQNLDQKGDFINILNQSARDEFPHIKRFSSYVGLLRGKYPDKLTDRHEQQIFNWLYKGEKKNVDTPKEAFFDKIEKQIDRLDFSPDQPLVLKRGEVAQTGTRGRTDTAALERELDQLREDRKKARTPQEVDTIDKEIARISKGIAEIVKTQPDLFNTLEEKTAAPTQQKTAPVAESAPVKPEAPESQPTAKNYDRAVEIFNRVIDRSINKPTEAQQEAVREELEAAGVHPIIIQELTEPKRSPRPEEADFPEEIGIGDAYDFLRKVESKQYATTRKGRIESAIYPPAELKSKVDAIADAGKAMVDAEASLEQAKKDIISEIESRGGEVVVNTDTGAFTIKLNTGKGKMGLQDILALKKLRQEAAEAGAYSLATVGRGFEIAVTPEKVSEAKPLAGTFAEKAKEFIQRNQAEKEAGKALDAAKRDARNDLVDHYLAERVAGRKPQAFNGTASDGTAAQVLIRRNRSAVEPDIAAGGRDFPAEIQSFKEEAATRSERGKPFISTRETGKKTFAEALKAGRVVDTASRAFGESNTLVTKEEFEKSLKNLQDKFSQLNVGIDPSMFFDLLKVGTYYVQGGAIEFKAWSAKMIEKLGDKVEPYLKTVWDEIKKRRPGLFKAAKATTAPDLFSEPEPVAPQKPVAEKTVEPKTAPSKTKAEKEPWEMTKREYYRQRQSGTSQNMFDIAATEHRASVSNAIRANKPVPANVLADYPDLAKLAKGESVATPKPEPPKNILQAAALKAKAEKTPTPTENKSANEKPLRPDGRLDPQPGDKVYMMAQGFGGTAAYINGEVYEKGGQRRVRITGAASLMGGGYSGAKTVALDGRWTVSGDPEIKRREQAREEERKQQSAKLESQRQSGLDAQKENIAKAVAAGEKIVTDATKLKRGQVVTYHDPVGGSTKYQTDDVRAGDESVGLYEIGKTPEWGTDNDGNIIRYFDVIIQIWGTNNKNIEQLTTTGEVKPLTNEPTLDMPNLPEWVKNDLEEKEALKPAQAKPSILQQAAKAATEINKLSSDIVATKFSGTLPDGRKLVAKNIATRNGAQQGYAKDNANREIVEYKEANGAQRFAVVEKAAAKAEAPTQEQRAWADTPYKQSLLNALGGNIELAKEAVQGIGEKLPDNWSGTIQKQRATKAAIAEYVMPDEDVERVFKTLQDAEEQTAQPSVKEAGKQTEAKNVRSSEQSIPPAESVRENAASEPKGESAKAVRGTTAEQQTETGSAATRRERERGAGERQAESSPVNVPEATRQGGERSGEAGADIGATGESSARSGARNADVSERRAAAKSRRESRGVSYEGDFRITDATGLGKGGKRQKFSDNLAAIRLLKQLEAEGRAATPEEQSILVKYVGWGGLAQEAFGYTSSANSYRAERSQLEELLTDDEQAAARASTPNAHYTSPPVVRAIYSVLQRFGFKGGKVIEPGSGIGNFIGLLPDELYGKTRFTAIEMDEISGRILKKLYPSADLRLEPFQNTKMPNNFYDAMTGNVPFGNVNLFDPEINKKFHQKFSIHNFFIIKALEKLRPGGVMGFITSRYTMDSQAQDFRKLVGQQADFIGAIRLPKETFGENAQTEVVTDILFFKKRGEGETVGGAKWTETKPIKGVDGDAIEVNEYYAKHPEMMIGDASVEGSMYRANEPTWSLENAEAVLPQEIAKRVENLPEGIYSEGKPARTDDAITERTYVPGPNDVKQGGFGMVDGRIGIAEGVTTDGGSIKQAPRMRILTDLPKAQEEKIRGMIAIRGAIREVYKTQLENALPAAQDRARVNLGKEYDAFVKKHGFLNLRENRKAFESDPDAYIVLALENFNPDTKQATKTDIFSKSVVDPRKAVTKADTAADALAVSLSQKGVIDFDLMSELTGKDEETLQNELAGLAYHVPGAGWVPADEYLSGNVRDKLENAREAAKVDPAFKANVEALEKVQPEPLDASQVIPRVGATWVPADAIAEFADYLSGGNNAWKATHLGALGRWEISEKSRYSTGRLDNTLMRSKWGTSRIGAIDLLRDALNLKTPTVYDSDGEGGRILNEQETSLAQQKLQEIKDEFVDWAYKEPERRKALVESYNRNFNNVRLRSFNGDHLTFDGASKNIKLRKHQRDAVWRILSGGNTLIGHVVGAGKTFTMIAAGMEARRMGIFKKPMYVVRKHMLEQFRKEFLQLYPNANILVADEENFHGSVRKQFMARIATGDWDAVIVTHPSLKFIPMSKETEMGLLKEQFDEMMSAEESLRETLGDSAKRDPSVKELEKARMRISEKLKELNDTKRDDAVTFEQLGVDMMFVDESQNFKNLFYATKMNRVLGLGSQQGGPVTFDMYMKTRYISKLNGGERGVVFSTGTPISNSMSEMYLLMKYLQPQTLQESGLNHFDSWASTFGDVVTAIERTSTGKFEPRSRFAKFVNIPELAKMFRRFADIRTADDLPELKDLVPKLKGGEVTPVLAQSSPELTDYMKALVRRAEELHGRPEKGGDNHLNIATDARKAGLDMRLIDPRISPSETPKVELAAENIYKLWRDTGDKKSTQIVFADMSAPAKDKFNVYDELKRLLVEKGMPAKDIAFIHDADTDTKKLELFNKVNRGDVRVIVGSTPKLGEGTNVQRKLIAIHHLDAPWRPSDVEQRNGRIIRQGNENKEVYEYRYATERSFDTNMWQKLEQKARFISQVMTSDLTVREAEDITDAFASSAAEMKAITSGDPRIMELVQLENDIEMLEILRSGHRKQIFELQDKIAHTSSHIESIARMVAVYEKDDKLAQETADSEEFSLKLGNQTYGSRKDAGDAIIDAAKNKQKLVGEYRGFKIEIKPSESTISDSEISIRGNDSYRSFISESNIGTIASLDNAIRSISGRISSLRKESDRLARNLQTARNEVNRPFKQEKELQSKVARKFQILGELAGEDKKREQGKGVTTREDELLQSTAEESSKAEIAEADKTVKKIEKCRS